MRSQTHHFSISLVESLWKKTTTRRKMRQYVIAFTAIILTAFSASVEGHGRLIFPPSRSSMWRTKNTDPLLEPFSDVIQANYNDNQLFCGGKATQTNNGGKCGVCGDAYDAADKPNEAGGKYALGIITRYYEQGQQIEVRVEITAAHKGYFEFRLCPWNNIHVPVTQECLNNHLLNFADGSTKYHLPDDSSAANGVHIMNLKLPADVTCEQCLLQWRYRTGNSWGTDPVTGHSDLGLGQQEEFYGCSDVAISSDGPAPSSSSIPAQSPSTLQQTSTAIATEAPPQSATTSATNYPQTDTASTTAASSTSTTMGRPAISQPAKAIDCSTTKLGKTVFRDCNSFFVCAHVGHDPFVFMCAPGTVCDMTDGRCKHAYEVPYPCGLIP